MGQVRSLLHSFEWAEFAVVVVESVHVSFDIISDCYDWFRMM